MSNKIDVRLAQIDDLPFLKIMFEGVVKNMRANNINIWNEYYPYEEFEEDIEREELYVVVKDNVIAGAFCLLEHINGIQNFGWKSPSANALYLSRLGVNSDYLSQGIASFIINKATNIALQRNCLFLRLVVSEDNLPAINVYKRNKFYQVAGTYNEFSQSLNKDIVEIGFEKEIVGE